MEVKAKTRKGVVMLGVMGMKVTWSRLVETLGDLTEGVSAIFNIISPYLRFIS